jgi:hypothetical protein
LQATFVISIRGFLTPALGTELRIRLQNVPSANLLLTNSRLKEEAQSTRSQLSAEIHVMELERSSPLVLTAMVLDESRANDALYHVRHITIGLHFSSSIFTPYQADYWMYIQQLVKHLSYKTPHFASLRIAIQYKSTVLLPTVGEVYTESTSSHFLPSPPNAIVGFLLKQRAEGYCRTPVRLVSQSTEEPSKYFQTNKAGSYCYQIDANTKHLWKREEAYELFFGGLNQGASWPLIGDPNNFTEWREKSGGDENEAEF